jgi:hypothetical protein
MEASQQIEIIEKMIKRGYVSTPSGIKLPYELRKIHSKEEYENDNVKLETDSESVYFNGNIIIHKVLMRSWEDRLMSILWSNVNKGIWTIKVRENLHLK